MEHYFAIFSDILLVLTAIIATWRYPKFKNTPLRYLPAYLWYASLLEIVGYYMLHTEYSNTWWYNIGINIEILFYLWLFYRYISSKRIKTFIIFGALVFESYFFIQVLWLESIFQYQVFPFTLGSVLVILAAFVLLLEMFQSDKILYTKKYFIFWISLGVLFYNIIPLPLFIVRSIIPPESLINMMGIQFSANCIMYVLFIYGFIWSSMNYKSLS